jgi:hypothetical protein
LILIALPPYHQAITAEPTKYLRSTAGENPPTKTLTRIVNWHIVAPLVKDKGWTSEPGISAFLSTSRINTADAETPLQRNKV